MCKTKQEFARQPHRLEFEKYARSKKLDLATIYSGCSFGYLMSDTHEADETWQAALAAALEQAETARNAERCVWTPASLAYNGDPDEPDAYETSCGRTWVWFDIEEHGVKCCFDCGKRIEIKEAPNANT